MQNTDAALAGILEATADSDLPRVVAQFTGPDGRTVSIVEPVIGDSNGGRHRRGYLWHAIVGDFFLTPTRRGDADPSRFVPGVAALLPGAELLSCSSTSASQAASNARRLVRGQMNRAGQALAAQ